VGVSCGRGEDTVNAQNNRGGKSRERSRSTKKRKRGGPNPEIKNTKRGKIATRASHPRKWGRLSIRARRRKIRVKMEQTANPKGGDGSERFLWCSESEMVFPKKKKGLVLF